jgi:hypothetical protein
MIPSPKRISYFRQTVICQFLCQGHGQVARSGNRSCSSFRIEVRQSDFEILSDGLLDIVYAHLPVLDRQQIFQ